MEGGIERGGGKEGGLTSLFPPDIVKAISRVQIPHHVEPNSFVWTPSKLGKFSVRSILDWLVREICTKFKHPKIVLEEFVVEQLTTTT